MDKGRETGDVKISIATRKLHNAIDSIEPPPQLLYTGNEEIQWGNYDDVLAALRGFVAAGGKPLNDERFIDFLRRLVSFWTPRFEEEPPEIERDFDRKKFVDTALRICGAEIKRDGSISLVGLYANRPKKE